MITRYAALLIFFCLAGQAAWAAGEDSFFTHSAPLDKEQWNLHKKDFNYPQPASPAFTPGQSRAVPTLPSWIKYFIFLLVAGLLVYLLIRLVKNLPPARLQKISETAATANDNLPAEAWPSVRDLEQSVQREEWRNTVRIAYLLTIRELGNKKLIVTAKDKTNNEYAVELTNDTLLLLFREIAYTFERTWYGEFMSGEKTGLAMMARFKKLHSILNQQ